MKAAVHWLTTKGVYWVNRGIDWISDRMAELTDPRWLAAHPVSAAILVLVVVTVIGWVCLKPAKRA